MGSLRWQGNPRPGHSPGLGAPQKQSPIYLASDRFRDLGNSRRTAWRGGKRPVRLREVRSTMRPPATNQASIRMRQSEFEPTQFASRVRIAGFGGASQPITVSAKVTPIEGVHRKMLCAVPLAEAEGAICEPFLAKCIRDTARRVERPSELRHRQRIVSKREVPDYRHGIAIPVIVADATISRPQPILSCHGSTMPRLLNVCNRVGRELVLMADFRALAARPLPGGDPLLDIRSTARRTCFVTRSGDPMIGFGQRDACGSVWARFAEWRRRCN